MERKALLVGGEGTVLMSGLRSRRTRGRRHRSRSRPKSSSDEEEEGEKEIEGDDSDLVEHLRRGGAIVQAWAW